MKKETRNYFKKSHELAAKYLNGDKNITIRDIEKQEYIDRLHYLLDYCSFSKGWLKPIVAIPVFFYSLFLD